MYTTAIREKAKIDERIPIAQENENRTTPFATLPGSREKDACRFHSERRSPKTAHRRIARPGIQRNRNTPNSQSKTQMNFIDLFEKIDSIFSKCQIAYALIGGYAVAAWGEERATQDIDLLCLSDSQKIIRILREENLQFEHRVGDWDDPISEVIRINWDDEDNPLEVDILIGIKNAPIGILDRIHRLTIEGLAIPVASPEDIILLKLLAGSARDIDDARSILQIQGAKLDCNLIRQLCPENQKDIWEKLACELPKF
jgi:predicted nucleotidyltransferase